MLIAPSPSTIHIDTVCNQIASSEKCYITWASSSSCKSFETKSEALILKMYAIQYHTNQAHHWFSHRYKPALAFLSLTCSNNERWPNRLKFYKVRIENTKPPQPTNLISSKTLFAGRKSLVWTGSFLCHQTKLSSFNFYRLMSYRAAAYIGKSNIESISEHLTQFHFHFLLKSNHS